MKILTIAAAIQKALELAEYNERNRLFLSEGKIYGYFLSTNQRLANLNAEESAEIIINKIAEDPRYYEYEPGRLHLNA